MRAPSKPVRVEEPRVVRVHASRRSPSSPHRADRRRRARRAESPRRDRARHRAGGVLRVRDRDDPGAAHEPDRRLDADEPHAADGHTIEPSVSVPIAGRAEARRDRGRRARARAARRCGRARTDCAHCPPRPLQPLDECVDRKFAHSLRFVLPRITAPAARSRSATNASRGATRRRQRERAGGRRASCRPCRCCP